MNKPDPNLVRDMRHGFDLTGAAAEGNSLVSSGKVHRVKVFKSGNSLAVRMPKALGLEAGMQLELSTESDGDYRMKRADAPKRKIDVSKFWGKAPWLKELTSAERETEHRELDWHLLSKPDKGR